VLYIKNKGSEIWGTLQSRPRHTSEPYINNIKQEGDIVKYFSQENQIKKENPMSNSVSLNTRIYDFDNNAVYTKDFIDKLSNENKLYIEIYYYQANNQGKYHEPAEGRQKVYAIEDINNPGIHIPINKEAFDYAREKGAVLLELTQDQANYRHDELQGIFKLSGDERKQFELKIMHKFYDIFGVDSDQSPAQAKEKQDFLSEKLDAQNAYYQEIHEAYQDRKSPAARADENIIKKENSMSMKFDEIGNIIPKEKERDPKEEAFLNALHQRKVITDAMKAGNLSCMPRADGFADTTPAVNLVNGTNYHGLNLLILKEHTRENGFPAAEYLTSEQIQKAKEVNPAISIRQGQKGVSIYVSEKNEETGDWENKSFRLFNVAQTNKPKELKIYAEQKQQEKLAEKEAYLQTQYGSGFKLEPKKKETGPDVVCSSAEPEKYLAQYLAAVSMNSKFKVNPEQAAEFAQKMENTLYTKMANGHTNPFVLSKISNEASSLCKDFIKETKMEARKLEQPQQELTQNRGHKM